MGSGGRGRPWPSWAPWERRATALPRGARRGRRDDVDPQIPHVAEDERRPDASRGVEAGPGQRRAEPDQGGEQRHDGERRAARQAFVGDEREDEHEQRGGHGELDRDRFGRTDHRMRHGAVDRLGRALGQHEPPERGARRAAGELGGDVPGEVVVRDPSEHPEAECDRRVRVGSREPSEGRHGDERDDGGDEHAEGEEARAGSGQRFGDGRAGRERQRGGEDDGRDDERRRGGLRGPDSPVRARMGRSRSGRAPRYITIGAV